ncbi:hypothetical protein PFAG_00368 [Plasmodium falciparum Santa Lucia]|uniref:Uncharacterized protein n=3 Tax=Plasmodium falciparum TaxID=5833 RepID=A0A024WEY1_PLAFA|nr:hypothetical protein PFTANZ_00502 [Plasmodium falciparum Tanzania (2000708)]EUR80942.1 hypothetical protein PFBG_00308 [Plasmodium falciparum 7G8]EUT92228.1 hypothetical protein PFAG_00368 [Plasmodium falciparum Santa Lucia]
MSLINIKLLMCLYDPYIPYFKKYIFNIMRLNMNKNIEIVTESYNNCLLFISIDPYIIYFYKNKMTNSLP